MKKFIVLISLLLFAAACTAPAPTPPVANTNTAERSEPAITEADAIAKEKAIWETIKTKDYDSFSTMLADDELEVNGDGVMQKAASISMVKDFEPSEITFSDWKFLIIDKDAFVVTYTVNVKGKYKGKEMPPVTARGSSAWANRDGKWVAVYHQESDVKTAMPAATPAAAAKATASPAASPATSPMTATTSSDVTANEKMVWDLFKAAQFDAFATVLAPEFIEVEPDGVFDKAGTIKGVQGAQFSKDTLSEFKTVNIDNDAAIVTYLVTTAGPKTTQARHTTIWAVRSGKWLAIFHHGTPANPMGATSLTPVPAPSATITPSPMKPEVMASPVKKQ